MTSRFSPAGPLRGELRPPADKSISHRAAIVAAMGEGSTTIEGYLDAGDTRSTLAAVAALGAGVEKDSGGEGSLTVQIEGIGLRGAREAEIDVGNAGTLLRILPGWLAGQTRGAWALDGDASIRRRPVDRIAIPLRAMGARVECRDDRLPPLRIEGAELRGIEYRMPVASAQVKSCLLLAGLVADGPTTVVEPAPSRDHTERMLRAAGAVVTSSEPTGDAPATVSHTVEASGQLALGRVSVPADFSSAAFWLVAAAIVPGSEVRISECGINPTRSGLLGILTRMGAPVAVSERRELGGEPLARLLVRHSELRGTHVTGAEVPAAIDELPLVGLLGCFAEGETRVSGAEELRHKESDRIAAVVSGLRALGGDIDELADGFVARGTGGLHGGVLDADGDHRLAMLGAIAGLASREGVQVRGMDAAAVSYPSFEDDLAALAQRSSVPRH